MARTIYGSIIRRVYPGGVHPVHESQYHRRIHRTDSDETYVEFELTDNQQVLLEDLVKELANKPMKLSSIKPSHSIDLW